MSNGTRLIRATSSLPTDDAAAGHAMAASSNTGSTARVGRIAHHLPESLNHVMPGGNVPVLAINPPPPSCFACHNVGGG